MAFRNCVAVGRVVTRELELYSIMTQRITRETNREETFNVELARMLRDHGISCTRRAT